MGGSAVAGSVGFIQRNLPLDTKISRLGQFGGRPIKKGAIFPGPTKPLKPNLFRGNSNFSLTGDFPGSYKSCP